jgi:hypothetical protein
MQELVYIFGGKNSKNEIQSDLILLEMDNGDFLIKKPRTKGTPPGTLYSKI